MRGRSGAGSGEQEPLAWHPGPRRVALVVAAITSALVMALGGLAPPARAQSGAPSVVSLLANVVAAAGLTGPTPTGSVTFTVDAKALATVSLVNGLAQLSTTALGPGTHIVVAAYSGDSTHPPGLSIVALPAGQGEVRLTIALNPTSSPPPPPPPPAPAPPPPPVSPTVRITSPRETSYPQGALVRASFSCREAGAPVGVCVGRRLVGGHVARGPGLRSGEFLSTSTPGSYDFRVTGADAAGNRIEGSVHYVVDACPGSPSCACPTVGGCPPAPPPPPPPPPPPGPAPAPVPPPAPLPQPSPGPASHCQPGTLSAGAGATLSCSCPPGASASGAGTSLTCSCPAGATLSGTGCACAPGVSATGSASTRTCGCPPRPAGSCRPVCPAGSQPRAGSGSGAAPACLPCPAGTVCSPCPVGTSCHPQPGCRGCTPIVKPACAAGPAICARPCPVNCRKQVLNLEVVGFTLLALAGDTGLALAGAGAAAGASGLGRGRPDEEKRDEAPDLDQDDEADVVFLAVPGGRGAGDRSRTWRWPGYMRVDRASMAVPQGIDERSPFLARIFGDGAYLRSMLGSLAVFTDIIGVVLGVLASIHTAGAAVPPGLALTIGIAVLGVIDATAGLLAVAVFAAGVISHGGLDAAGARTVIALCGLWFVVPLLAGATRPLRRERPGSPKARFDRLGDFVIASLIGAWAVQKIVVSLPRLGAKDNAAATALAGHAGTVAVAVLVAVPVRMIGESLAARRYPERLRSVEPGDREEPGPLMRVVSAAARTAIFVFVAYVIVGDNWQLWVGGVLFLLPKWLHVYDEVTSERGPGAGALPRFPKSRSLGRALPEGLVLIVLLLFVLTALKLLVFPSGTPTAAEIPDAFVILGIPGAVLSVLGRFGKGKMRTIGWTPRLVGTLLLIAGVVLVLGLL